MQIPSRFLIATALAGAGALFSPLAAQAHGTWLATIHGEPTVMYGHHESESDPYDPTRVVDLKARKNGKNVSIKAVAHEDKYATLEADNPGVVGYTLDNGFWYKDGKGKWHNQPKDKAADPAAAKDSSRSIKYSVSYLTNREPVKALGYELEIVPASNPAKLRQGEKLSVQVLYQGKPLSNTELIGDFFSESGQVKTDAEGRATVPVAREGLNTLAVEYETPYSDTSKADSLSLFSGLNFFSHEDEHEH